tara:strand:- start:466 stop:705 length:240 start_codon:yes stop_codon:yes gene_type:complete
MKNAVLTLNQGEANTLLIAIESAMVDATREADTNESQAWVIKLDALWHKLIDAGTTAGFGNAEYKSHGGNLDLMQCSEV